MTDQSSTGAKADILIIDDIPDNLRLLNQILSKYYKVRLAPSGSIGLAAARSALPDLILLDIMMPDMDGFEVATRFKADPQTAGIPIIFISALGDTNSKIRGFKAGGVDFITKPFQEEEVLARAKTHLALRDLYLRAQAEIAERKRVEEKLRRSEERFRLLISSTEDIVLTLDRDQRITGIYGSWFEKNGLTPDQFLGKNANEMFGEAGTTHEDANQRALAGEYVIYDWSATGPEGLQYYQTSLSPMRDASGEIIGIVSIGRNITDRKRAEVAEHQQHLLAEALRDTAESLNSSLNLDDIFEKILDKVDLVVKCNAMSVAWLEDNQVSYVRIRGYDTEQAKALREATYNIDDFETHKQVVRTHQPVQIACTQDWPSWKPSVMTAWVQSHLEAPIVIGDKVVGIINLESATPGYYTREHAEILQTFANQVAVAVRNAQLYAETQHLTIIDPLTGLYNRRGLYSLGIREMERVKMLSRSVCIFFLDVDHFKLFNDAYSYEVGDQILCAVARLIRSQVRAKDIVCRYGGEEFVVLMPELSITGAAQAAERLRVAIETARHPVAGGDVSITTSIGVAALEIDKTGLREAEQNTEQQLGNLVERAGAMLHVAKQNGRNRVEIEY
jgi:diguanylate cyclase (GGDEF)-like protein/PAS domain S-box-containing protein